MLWDWVGLGMLGGMVALIFWELVQEARGSKEPLHDRYHE
jgi:hypothetical protein